MLPATANHFGVHLCFLHGQDTDQVRTAHVIDSQNLIIMSSWLYHLYRHSDYGVFDDTINDLQANTLMLMLFFFGAHPLAVVASSRR